MKDKIIQGPEFKYILTPVVSSLVGSPNSSYKDGPLVTAGFGTPYGMTFDSDNNLYVCDRTNHSIRKITSDVISTIAGNPQLTSGYQDGNGSNARFTWPVGIKFNSEGNLIISDLYGIRTMNKSADVTAIAGSLTLGFKDGVGAEASFTSVEGIAINQNDEIFIVDNENSSIRKVTKEGVVTTLAGDGTRGLKNGAGLSAQFNEPYGIAIDKSGNLYVADTFNNLIRKVTPDGTVTTFAGDGIEGYRDGVLSVARFYYPRGLTFDAEGNLLVVERGNHRIRKISVSGEVTTLAGNGSPGITDGKAMSAKFNQPTDIAINSKGEIYISELGNRMIRKIEFK
jgi:sugar lactone lactonase YvrE